MWIFIFIDLQSYMRKEEQVELLYDERSKADPTTG
jgi:hypothetical protein